jgi:hypothetical protein
MRYPCAAYFSARVRFCAALFWNRGFPRDFWVCSNPVLSSFADALKSPSAKEKVDTRKWKVDFLDQHVLVFYPLPSTFYHLRSLRRCISPRAAQIESFFESRESLKHWGFECASLTPIHAGGGGRIRTIRVIS